ncbi:MAG: phytanoyl-CoA dioxygenase family protein [Proteobacteria bacterium]|nr:phytanoyl-CoA dioxygenase family protein [Pseudomonadota bacterium]
MCPVDAELRERFQRDGFVVVPDLLAADELERLGAAVDRAVARRREKDRRSLAEKSRYEQSFLQCINLWETDEAVRPLTFHARIGQAAASLLGVDAVRLWHDQALYKEPGGRETDAHQDQAYWPIHETENVSAWIPFAGSTLDGGAMGYVPGSHRFGVRKFVNIFTDPEPYDLVGGPESRGVEPVFVEVPPGSVAFHHALTFHVSKPNKTDRMRRVHTMIFFADGATRGKKGPPHFAVDRAKIPVGEPIRSDVTPIAWPRGEGEFPPPPSDGFRWLR